MEYKEYRHLNFNEIYKAKGYPKETWQVLNEYLSRYAYEFYLTHSEIQSKLSILIDNLDDIRIEKNISSRKFSSIRPRGHYSRAFKCIRIDEKETGSPEDVLDTIFVQLNHVLENPSSDATTSFEANGKQDLSTDINDFNEGLALNEIIAQLKASRLAKNDRTNLSIELGNKKYIPSKGSDYKLAFIGTMLHTSLGISELEFLKTADMGKPAFNSEMAKKFSDEKEYETFINSIIFCTDTLHSTIYGGSKNESLDKEDLHNIEYCISRVYNESLQAMEKVMLNNILENKDGLNMDAYLKECRFNLKQLTENYKYGLNQNLGKKDIDLSENPNLLNLKRRILAIEAIIDAKTNLTPSQYDDALSDIANMDIGNEEKLADLYDNYKLFQLEDIESFDEPISPDYQHEVLAEDYGHLGWNNEGMQKPVHNFLKMGTLLYRVTSYIKHIIKYKETPLPRELLPDPALSHNEEREAVLSKLLSDLVNNDPDFDPDFDIDPQPRIREERNPEDPGVPQ